MKMFLIMVLVGSVSSHAEGKFTKWKICVNDTCNEIKDGEYFKIDENCSVTSVDKNYSTGLKERSIYCSKKNVNGENNSEDISCDKMKENKSILDYSENLTYSLSCSK